MAGGNNRAHNNTPNTKDAPLIESLATHVKPENAKLTVEITTILGMWVHTTQHTASIHIYVYGSCTHTTAHFILYSSRKLDSHTSWLLSHRKRKNGGQQMLPNRDAPSYHKCLKFVIVNSGNKL